MTTSSNRLKIMGSMNQVRAFVAVNVETEVESLVFLDVDSAQFYRVEEMLTPYRVHLREEVWRVSDAL